MNLEKFLEDVRSKIGQNDLKTALNQVVEFTQKIAHDPRAVATVFGSERLDQLCAEIGQTYREQHPLPAKTSANHVFIASHLAHYGGHTLVLEDMLKTYSSSKPTLLLLDLFGLCDQARLRERFFSVCDLRIAPSGDFLQKLSWLANELDQLAPRNIFLFNHHEDAVMIAEASQWVSRAKVFFVHHADYALCLGVHLKGTLHVDLSNIGYCCCQDHEKIRNNLYLPLTCADKKKQIAPSKLMENGDLTTCSSGTSNKFSTDYPYTYFELIALRLSLRSGVHYHIGNLTDAQQKMLAHQLSSHGVDPDRFIHIEWVKSIWDAVIELKVDLYLCSFPLGGGRTAIEIMGAGVPILIHQNSVSRFHGGHDLVYPEAFVWRTEERFKAHLMNVTREVLSAHSAIARKWYEEHYTPELFQSAFQSLLNQQATIAPPALQPYTQDPLERFILLSMLSVRMDVYLKSQQEVEHSQQKVEHSQREVEQLKKAVSDMMNSRSWKITKPMRWFSTMIRNLMTT